jgi:hypothetical protein
MFDLKIVLGEFEYVELSDIINAPPKLAELL